MLVHCRSLLGKVRRSWRGCAAGREASGLSGLEADERVSDVFVALHRENEPRAAVFGTDYSFGLYKASSTLATISANSITSICCGFVAALVDHKLRRRRRRQTCEQHKRRCVRVVPVTLIIIRLYYNTADFVDKFAEFVCWTSPLLYKTKTENAGEFSIYVFCVRHFEVYSCL